MNYNLSDEELCARQEYEALSNARYDELTARIDNRDSAISMGIHDLEIGPGQAEYGYENLAAAWNSFGNTAERAHGNHDNLHGGQLHRLNRIAQGEYHPPPLPRASTPQVTPATDLLGNFEHPGAKGLAEEVPDNLLYTSEDAVEPAEPAEPPKLSTWTPVRAPTPHPGSRPSRRSSTPSTAPVSPLTPLLPIPTMPTRPAPPPPIPTESPKSQKTKVFYGSLKGSRYAD